MRRFFIYALSDPRTNQVRYIGQSTVGLKRPRQRHHAHCRKWELLLERLGLQKQIDILEEFETEEELDEAETFWIGYWRMVGANLTNRTGGGEGGATRNGMKNSVHHRSVFTWKGRHHSEETKRHLGELKKGKKQTAEFVEKRIAPLRGKKQTEEAKKNSGNAIRAYWQTERAVKHRETLSVKMRLMRTKKKENAGTSV